MAATATCEPDPATVGVACGACQQCAGNGTCQPCPACCETTICIADGALCDACHGCQGRSCDPLPDGTSCNGDGVCCGATCETGACCTDDDCDGATPICQEHTCIACTAHSQCGPNALCLPDGSCAACDVCQAPGTCTYSTVRAAVDDDSGPSTIYICPGTYLDRVRITRDLTLIGAGDGDGAGDTILQGDSTPAVSITSAMSDVTLRGLRLTGGRAVGLVGGGGIAHEGAALTVIDCTVTGNTSDSQGGGVSNESGGTLEMTGCTIRGNHGTGASSSSGGGIYNTGQMTLTDCLVTGNTAGHDGGGIFSVGSATLVHSVVSGNTANWGGGIANGGTLNLSDCSVTGNRGISNCGGILNAGSATLDDSRVSDNWTDGACFQCGVGGGIQNQGGTVTLHASTVGPDNRAVLDGGGIYNDATSTVELENGSSVSGNTLVGGAPNNCAGPGDYNPDLPNGFCAS